MLKSAQVEYMIAAGLGIGKTRNGEIGNGKREMRKCEMVHTEMGMRFISNRREVTESA